MSFSDEPYYDISPVVSEKSAVFPGDTSFSREILLDFKSGSHLDLSTIRTTLHIGAHADAPSHYHRDGASIEKRDLRLYFGQAQVIEARAPRGTAVTREHLATSELYAPRILLKTRSHQDPDEWTSDFNWVSESLIEWLASKGVRLIGIDTPSVDFSDSKTLLSHQTAFKHDLAILEGLVLESVPDGVYTLTALPLKLAGAEASPVRAVLWSSNAWKK